jgi:hypothetical protein
MRRIDARRKNASALRLRFSQSLASLRQRLSQRLSPSAQRPTDRLEPERLKGHSEKPNCFSVRVMLTFNRAWGWMTHVPSVVKYSLVVICPGCKIPMLLKEWKPLLFSNLDTIVFRCVMCGTETKREVKRDTKPRK